MALYLSPILWSQLISSSEYYVKDVNSQIAELPREVWNNGTNHIIFNLYFGTYPHYSSRDLGFDTGKAMIAWASPDLQVRLFCPSPKLEKDMP